MTAYFLIALAALAANLPFINERIFALVPNRKNQDDGRPPAKAFWIRLLELFILYLVVGLIGRSLEKSAGNVAEQEWQFYAISFAMFVVFAFPGFIWRYLRKKHD